MWREVRVRERITNEKKEHIKTGDLYKGVGIKGGNECVGIERKEKRKIKGNETNYYTYGGDLCSSGGETLKWVRSKLMNKMRKRNVLK